jgi:hypothetical protein
MKIAVWNGFDFHYEMFGYILEYIKYTHIPMDLYVHIDMENCKEWIEIYKKIFNFKFNWIKITTHEILSSYDLIILLTDDDETMPNEFINIHGKDKIICIDHHTCIRRENMLERIGTRFFYNRPNCKWALPCYYGINKIDKIKLLENNDKIIVSCIGMQNQPPNIQFLRDLFSNFDDIEFNILAREIKYQYENVPNVKIFENTNSNNIIDIVKKSHYMLCIGDSNNTDPIKLSMSASIPMSFTFGCKIIIPYTWNEFYNLKSVIEYKDEIIQKNGLTKIILTKQTLLNDIYDELYDLVSHKNKIFDNCISLIDNNFTKKLENTTIHSQVSTQLNLIKPNIFLSIGNINNNDLSIIQNEFRMIHIFSNDIIKNNDSNYVYFHNYDDIKKIVCKINEPIYVYIDILNENIIIKLLKLLSKRTYSDQIVFNNYDKITNYFELYKKIYNRYNVVYYTSENKIIIIPQK